MRARGSSRRQKVSEPASPPRKQCPQPRERADETPSLIEKEQVDVERESPIEDNESVEREPRDRLDPPLFED
ncbi:MAG: hypothetical protein NTAFB05_18360 [Nitrobacter sp.]